MGTPTPVFCKGWVWNHNMFKFYLNYIAMKFKMVNLRRKERQWLSTHGLIYCQLSMIPSFKKLCYSFRLKRAFMLLLICQIVLLFLLCNRWYCIFCYHLKPRRDSNPEWHQTGTFEGCSTDWATALQQIDLNIFPFVSLFK